MNYIHYTNQRTKAGELMKQDKPLIKVHAANGRFSVKNECVARHVVNQIKSARNATGLQSTDYVNQYRRCDDDLRLAERLATASKYIGIGLFCFVAWYVILDLTFKALEMM